MKLDSLYVEQEMEAKKNSKGFDFSELKKSEIFNMIKSSVIDAIESVTNFRIRKGTAILYLNEEFCSNSIVVEADGNLYPCVYLGVRVRADRMTSDFVVKFSPFSAEFNVADGYVEKYNECNGKLTKEWKEILKTKYYLSYNNALLKFNETIKSKQDENEISL